MSTFDDPDSGAPTLPQESSTLRIDAGDRLGEAPTTPLQTAGSRAALGDRDSAARQGERYRVQRVLGVGGMGEVLLCRDTWLGRDVARKFMRTAADGSEGRMRFLREARVQGQLEHPAVVPVYDIAWSQDGEPSFTMKRIQGQTFRDIVEGLANGDPQTLALFSRRKLLAALLSASQAVSFAHARGVVHRDLKPENIMLGEFGEVYVLDWGIARSARVVDESDAAGSDALAATQAGTLVGTPGYMAPEQALGEIDAISPRSDVYSLGCILFELVSFRPYHQETNVAQLVADTITKSPIAPSAVAPHLDIPPELDAIAAKALSRDPGDRYSSARELALELERYLDGERNAELRRELAEEHLAEARGAFELAIRGGDAAEAERARGMRELGRALALDPTNEAALQLITRVVMSPSEQLPPDAESALQQVELADRVELAKQSFLSYLLWIPLVPLVFWMGIKNSGLAWAIGASVIAVMLYGIWMSATKNVGREFMRGAIFLNFVLIGVQSAIAGPLFIVPGAAALTASAFYISLRANRETQLLLAACAAGAIFLPLAAEWAGWLPASYTFEQGAILVQPRLAYFPRTATWVFLTMIAAVQLAISLSVVSRAVRALKAAERTNFAQAYRLGQLLPQAKAS